ncbi:hypothetical protein OKN36_21880 [Furfurilactobacillus sp. OKN36]
MKVSPKALEMCRTPSNWRNSRDDAKLIPIVMPIVLANELNDPATPVKFLSTTLIVMALLGVRNNPMPTPFKMIGGNYRNEI